MKPLRVLRIIARLNVGGPAQHVVWLTEGLASEGFETQLVAGTVPPGEQDMSGFAAAHGVTPLTLDSMSRELSWRDVTTIFRLWRIMRRFQPDIVHTHTAKAGAVGRIAGLFRRRTRFIHTFHGHVFHSYYGKLKTRLFLAIEQILARINTDRIVVLSEQQRDEIHRTFKIGRAEQFAIVPLGIDLAPCRAAPPAATAARTVGIVGRITAIKNHELFLRVAARVPEARFVVIGDGADREALEQRAAGRVAFLGALPVEAIYAQLDVVALTSRNEGTPLALIEAMAAGRPVISTAVGGVIDLLGRVVERANGYDVRERGITAASDDADGLTAGLRRLLDDEPLRRQLIDAGRAYVEKEHSKERLIADIIRLYRDVTK